MCLLFVLCASVAFKCVAVSHLVKKAPELQKTAKIGSGASLGHVCSQVAPRSHPAVRCTSLSATFWVKKVVPSVVFGTPRNQKITQNPTCCL